MVSLKKKKCKVSYQEWFYPIPIKKRKNNGSIKNNYNNQAPFFYSFLILISNKSIPLIFTTYKLNYPYKQM